MKITILQYIFHTKKQLCIHQILILFINEGRGGL
jgi:hypothetical protein